MNYSNNDTIAAIATPLGQGGIGLIRMSGSKSIDILKKVFRSKKNIDLSAVPSHTIHYGNIVDSSDGFMPIDEVLVSVMREPNTYTKEDVVEISAHASNIILQKILDIFLKNGARLAEPGEFTKRAFLNGRIDLTQAEAVIDLINSKTESESRHAIKHLKGDMSICVGKLQDNIKELLIEIDANIEFPEDHLKCFNIKNSMERINNLKGILEKLVKTYDYGKIIKNGISVVIVGKANTGKSSLFNKLIGSPQRALVTEIPGTTRDYLEESFNVKGVLFRITDTAGFKVPRGKIEKKSIQHTHKCIREADIVIFLLDGSKILSDKDLEIWENIFYKPKIICINKSDLKQKMSDKKLGSIIDEKRPIHISCTKNKGIDELKKALLKLSQNLCEIKTGEDLIITNIRHKNILERSLSCVKDAISATENNLSLEFISIDLRHALESLQEIIGEKISDTILDEIFSKFCIGK